MLMRFATYQLVVFLLEMISLDECFFLLRVFAPFANLPFLERGWPPEALPSPPPIGWSTGFMATPLTLERLPNQRFAPALPKVTRPWSGFEQVPMVALQVSKMRLVSPDGSFTTA
jgi:hypothetical protein